MSGEGARPEKPTPEAPLRGLTILNTREASAAPALTEPLERLGARVVERPAIAFAPPESWVPFDEALAALAPGQWVIFTSATAVRFAMERLAALGRGPDALAAARLACVGAGTAESLAPQGLAAALVPERFQQEELLAALAPWLAPGEPVWYPRAEEARPVLEEGLAARGARVRVTPVYRTVAPPGGPGPVPELLLGGELDWICFTSASTVRNFLAMLPPPARAAALAGPRIACLGRITAEAAREAGFSVAALPERQNLQGLIEAIVAAVQGGVA